MRILLKVLPSKLCPGFWFVLRGEGCKVASLFCFFLVGEQRQEHSAAIAGKPSSDITAMLPSAKLQINPKMVLAPAVTWEIKISA